MADLGANLLAPAPRARRLSIWRLDEAPEKVVVPSIPPFEELISNDGKRSKLSTIQFDITNWFISEDNFNAKTSFLNLLKRKENLASIAANIEEWCSTRHKHILKHLKYGTDEAKPGAALAYNIEAMHWAFLSEEASGSETPNEEADEELWWRFAVEIEGKKGSIPSRLDPDFDEVMRDLRDNASSYFYDAISDGLSPLGEGDLANALYYITKFSSGDKLLELILPVVVEKATSNFLENEIAPKFIFLCCLNQDDSACTMLDSFLSQITFSLSTDVVNASLEIAAYNSNPSCFQLIATGPLKRMLAVEGIISSLFVLCTKGNDKSLPIAQLIVIENTQKAILLSKANVPVLSEEGLIVENWISFVGPFIYTWLILSVTGTIPKQETCEEMIEFYGSPFKMLLNSTIPASKHRIFVDSLFQLACDHNQHTQVKALMNAHWLPDDLTHALIRATENGYQKLVGIMLDSLLEPDRKVKSVAGAVPVAFRKSKVLLALPIIGKRFPTEVANFLEGLSNIPVPLFVPVNSEVEPIFKSKTISGIHLGSGTLGEVLSAPKPDVSNEFVWNKLTFEGQLRKASSRSAEKESEVENIVCMAPMGLVADGALRELGGEFFRPTNSLIRLLAIDDERIILQPILQALVEFHWKNGGFWRRFAFQFIFLLCFLASMTYMFVLIVERQTSAHPLVSSALMPVTFTTLALSVCFIIQEIRQFLDSPREYFGSSGNLLDISVHTLVMYIIFEGSLIGNDVPVLLLSMAVLICSVRLLSHLGVFPSVGPLIRIWVTASVNVLPVSQEQANN